jgi:hypothetical protein
MASKWPIYINLYFLQQTTANISLTFASRTFDAPAKLCLDYMHNTGVREVVCQAAFVCVSPSVTLIIVSFLKKFKAKLFLCRS